MSRGLVKQFVCDCAAATPTARARRLSTFNSARSLLSSSNSARSLLSSPSSSEPSSGASNMRNSR